MHQRQGGHKTVPKMGPASALPHTADTIDMRLVAVNLSQVDTGARNLPLGASDRMREGVLVKINTLSKSFVVALAALLFAAIGSASYAQVLGTASLNVERRGHTATQITGGKILVVGGENTNGVVRQAEVFDPASQTFLIVGTSAGRTDHTATLLPDGR